MSLVIEARAEYAACGVGTRRIFVFTRFGLGINVKSVIDLQMNQAMARIDSLFVRKCL